MKKLILITLVLFSILVISCPSKSDESVTISFWTDQTQTERAAHIQLLLDTFEALHPNVTVELVPVDVNEITQRLAVAKSSGTEPNLLNTSTQFLLAADEDGLIDTNATADVISNIGVDQFYKGAIDLSKSVTNGGNFMVPYHFMVQGIWYRKDWFDDAGLAPPNTKESLLEAAKYFYRPQENQYGLLLGTKAGEQYNEQNFLHIATAHNAYLFNKDGSLAIDSPEMIEAIEYYKELAQYTPPGPQTWRGRDYYLQGRLAMFFYSSYIMDDLALQEVAASSLTNENFEDLEGAEFDKNLVVNTRVVPDFTWDRVSTYAEMGALSILKSDNQNEVEATQDLIEFLFEKDNYIGWLHLVPGGMFPVLQSLTATDEFLNDPKGVYQRYGADKILELTEGINNVSSFLIRDGKIYPQAATVASKLIIPNMLSKITIDNVPIAEAVAEAKQEIETLLY